MASHAFHEIYLHFNWHTKGDLPLITPEIEQAVYTILEHKCRSLKGVYCQGIGGTTKGALHEMPEMRRRE
ncbi:MAG: hypothetical protein ACYC7E_14095 [Armatimonadota bacterium]